MISGLSLSIRDLVDLWASMIQTYLVRRELCFVLHKLSVLSANLARNCEFKLPFRFLCPRFFMVSSNNPILLLVRYVDRAFSRMRLNDKA